MTFVVKNVKRSKKKKKIWTTKTCTVLCVLMMTFNTLAANYDLTRGLSSLPVCQTTSYLVLTYVKKSTCRFLPSFLKIAAAVNVLKNNYFVYILYTYTRSMTTEKKTNYCYSI